MLERVLKAREKIGSVCSSIGRQINIMEVCGTHTVSIFRNGIRTLLPANLKLLSGPGCPVCVTDQGYIDTMLAIARRDDCIIATYGDMIRVPGNTGSLETLHTGNVRVVLSSSDAVRIAKENPGKTVVFIAVGFETTAPATAAAIEQTLHEGVDNFCILCGHKLVVPAMLAILSDKNNRIDAFLCPGHVSVIIGYEAYEPVVEQFAKPCVVAGFEPLQIIEGIALICEQLAAGTPKVASVYKAAVTGKGNPKALELLEKYFETCDDPWRGLGRIAGASFRLRSKYRHLDALARLGIEPADGTERSGCVCGMVLCGLIDPPGCMLFGKNCTPDTPVGPCMVSSEGACSAWYKYGIKGSGNG